MPALDELTQSLRDARDLSPEAATQAAATLADEALAVEAKADFLRALTAKGETADEVAAFARYFRDRALDPRLQAYAESAVDIVGTGGDRASTFNISTFASFIVAAGGVTVLKHGNRAATSKCGSADLLEALGIPLGADTATLQRSVEATGFAFLFAQAFHPAFKAVGPVRKALAAEGSRTVFNLLGPLINPARPSGLLMGVFAEAWVEPLAEVLESLGLQSGLVVHGRGDGSQVFDELTCVGPNRVRGVGRLRHVDAVWAPEDFGCEACPKVDLAGGTLEENLARLQAILAGDAPRGLRDTLLCNAGAAFWIAGKVDSLDMGIVMAADLLDAARVEGWLNQAKSFFAQ
ncbi:MAG: anthranilate phosphoribosyltransferase [Opitutales bacterium]